MPKAKERPANENKEMKRDSQRDSQQEARQGEQQTGMQTRRGGYELQQQQQQQQPYSPFALMRRFNEEMDRLFQDFGFGRGFSGPSFGREMSTFGEQGQSLWSPQIEMFERGDELVVRADLPGMKRGDIQIDIADNALVIRGERRSERENEEEGYYRTERSYGTFYRALPLPEGVNTENAEASFRDGVLEITMAAPERSGRRRLEIREGEEEREERPRTRAAGAGQR